MKFNIFIFICTVIIFTSSANSGSFSLRDNKYLLNSAEVFLDAENQKELDLLEQDINQYVDTLSPDLKEKLGNWKNRFARFKSKISLLKPYAHKLLDPKIQKKINQNMPKGFNWKYNLYGFLGDTGLYTILGLKPISFPKEANNPFVNFIIKEFGNYLPFEIINKRYPEILILNKLNDPCSNPFINPETNFFYVASKDILFPVEFIKANYKDNIDLSPEFLRDFENLNSKDFKFFKEIVNKWASAERCKGDSDTIKPTRDEEAISLGLQPLVLTGKFTGKFNPANFRYLLLPPAVSTVDESPYIHLYSKVMEYLWRSLAGTKYYLKYLGHNIAMQDFDKKVRELLEQKMNKVKTISEKKEIANQARQKFIESLSEYDEMKHIYNLLKTL